MDAHDSSSGRRDCCWAVHCPSLQAEAEERVKAWAACTAEAQKLAQQFSEAEFISKLVPDPIEHGVIDSLRKFVAPMMGGVGTA